MEDLHEVTFVWPKAEPSTVIATGSFDQWSSSLPLTKREDGFYGSTKVPYGTKVTYKFIVDGTWTIQEDQPTEKDESGNVNNVFNVPEKPMSKGHPPVTNGDGSAANEPVYDNMNSTVSDLASTIVAADGTTSGLGYVTSGVGSVIKGVIGVDPFSPDKIAFETPKQESFPTPDHNPKVAETAPETAAIPTVVSPIVPVPLVPVKDPEHDDLVPKSASEVENTPIEAEKPVAESQVAEVSTHIVMSPKPTSPAAEETPAVNGTETVPNVPLKEAAPPPAAVTTPEPVTELEPVVTENGSVPTTAVNKEESKEPPAPTGLQSSKSVKEEVKEEPVSGVPSVPSTPKKSDQTFPSSPDSHGKDSPGSKFSTRKKRTSIFGRISLKGIFGDKDKEEKKEKK